MELVRTLAKEVGIVAAWIAGGILAGTVMATLAKLEFGIDYDARDLGQLTAFLVIVGGLFIRPLVARFRRGR